VSPAAPTRRSYAPPLRTSSQRAWVLMCCIPSQFDPRGRTRVFRTLGSGRLRLSSTPRQPLRARLSQRRSRAGSSGLPRRTASPCHLSYLDAKVGARPVSEADADSCHYGSNRSWPMPPGWMAALHHCHAASATRLLARCYTTYFQKSVLVLGQDS
jgi:hypothetical protein